MVTEEIAVLKEIAGDKILKVIVETCYLTEEEKSVFANVSRKAGRTISRHPQGSVRQALLWRISHFSENTSGKCKIKAAGGIRTREDMEAFLTAGADRIGASGAIRALYGE